MNYMRFVKQLLIFHVFNNIKFKSSLIFQFPIKIQFKNVFKMLKLAVFNSIKYSFNKETWVSDTAIVLGEA